MSTLPSKTCTAFHGVRSIATGRLPDVALAAAVVLAQQPDAAILVFDDATGAVIDLDLRGTAEEIIARLDRRESAGIAESGEETQASGRGRPKLGVVAREVTLLPRHWGWLATQRGGASNALRRLTDQARRDDEAPGRSRAAREAAYRFMSAMAGDRPAFEEAARALFADDTDRFARHAGTWPPDIRDHVFRLAWGDAAKTARSRNTTVAALPRKQIVAGFIRDVWSNGKVDACDLYLADSYTIHHDPGDPWDGRRLDLTEFKERVRLSRAPFPDQRFDIEAMFADGDAVVATWLWSATHMGDLPGFPGTGKPIAMSGMTAYFFDGTERISGHWQITDRLGVYRQLGAVG